MRDIGQHFRRKTPCPGKLLVERPANVYEIDPFDLVALQVREHRFRCKMGQLANQQVNRLFEDRI